MAPFPSELESILSNGGPESEDIADDEGSFDQHVQGQVDQLGEEPSLLQAVTVLLKQSARTEHEARQARQQQQHNLVETVKVVKSNHADIECLKQGVEDNTIKVNTVKDSQSALEKS